MNVKIQVVTGVEGDSLYINDYRIAGSKPWGGGRVIKEWLVDFEYLKEEIKRALLFSVEVNPKKSRKGGK